MSRLRTTGRDKIGDASSLCHRRTWRELLQQMIKFPWRLIGMDPDRIERALKTLLNRCPRRRSRDKACGGRFFLQIRIQRRNSGRWTLRLRTIENVGYTPDGALIDQIGIASIL